MEKPEKKNISTMSYGEIGSLERDIIHNKTYDQWQKYHEQEIKKLKESLLKAGYAEIALAKKVDKLEDRIEGLPGVEEIKKIIASVHCCEWSCRARAIAKRIGKEK